MDNLSLLLEKIHAVLPDIIDLRHQLHQIPEIGLKEYKTSARIRKYLEELGLPILPPVLDTDVTAILKGDRSGPTILLRADIDALPIEEATGVPYSSTHPSIAHSCGHDGHMAILLGTAKVLTQMREQIAGTVKFLFQPAEESEAGARLMVKAGYLEQEPKATEAYALHGWPGIPIGSVESCSGPILAAINNFEIFLTGSGGHGAVPEKAVDLLGAVSSFIFDMKQVVSRLNTPDNPVIISVCAVNGGNTYNVFPQRVSLKGTVRFLQDETGLKVKAAIKKSLDKNVLSIGGQYRIETPTPDYVSTCNDETIFKKVTDVAVKYLGKERWNGRASYNMGGEDFGFILQKVPGVYFRVGMGEDYPYLHNPTFNFNDEAIETGILMMCGLVLER